MLQTSIYSIAFLQRFPSICIVLSMNIMVSSDSTLGLIMSTPTGSTAYGMAGMSL